MFDLPMFTLIHVVISVLGIIAGLVVVGGFLAGRQLGTRDLHRRIDHRLSRPIEHGP